MTTIEPGPALLELLHSWAISRWIPTCPDTDLRERLQALEWALPPEAWWDRSPDERLWLTSPTGAFHPPVLHTRLRSLGIRSPAALARRTHLTPKAADRVWNGGAGTWLAHRVAVAQLLDGRSYGVDLRPPPPAPAPAEARRTAWRARWEERTTYVVVRALGDLLGLDPSTSFFVFDTTRSELGDEVMAMSEADFDAYVELQEGERFIDQPEPPDPLRDRARALLSELVAEFAEAKAKDDALRLGGRK